MAFNHEKALPRPGADHATARPRSLALPAVAGTEGAALAALVGLDGSARWQLARVLMTLTATVLAVWLVRRASGAGRGATALIAGIVGAVAGAGVAGAHLARAGPDAAAILAAIVLVAGLVLLVWAAVALVRAMPGWWRLLAIPVAWIVLEFALFPLSMAVFATNQPPGSLGSATPAGYGLAYRNVAFRTADGVRLSAWYIPGHNGAAVLVLPGSGSTRTAVRGQAAVLAGYGYATLMLDTRGHGRSGGHAMDFGWWGSRDIVAAVSFLSRQPGIDAGKIAVLGESMGGEQALAAMGSDQRIRAVVAEGVTGEQLADHGWRPHDIGGILQRGIEWVQYTAAGLLSGAPRPVLLIAAGAIASEQAAAPWFQAASPATVSVWIVPHAGHTEGLATAPRGWQAHVISFLNTALQPRSATTSAAGASG